MARKRGRRPRHRPPEAAPPPEPAPWIGSLLHAWPEARLDLHGRTVAEAESRVRDFLITQSRLGRGRIVHVITGKGTGVLFTRVGALLGGVLEPWILEHAPDLEGAGYRVRVR